MLIVDEGAKRKLIDEYRPRLAKHLGLKEEEVFPKCCEKHDCKMRKNKKGWYCEKCEEEKK